MNRKSRHTINRLALYEGIGDDLVFWVLIDTLFLTSVKGLTVAQISGVTFASCLMSVVMYFPIRRLIQKVGELNAMRIAAFLLLATALLFTFGTHLLTFAIAFFLYQTAFSFQGMVFSYTKNFLISIGQEREYAKLFARADRLYSTTTLVLAIASGFLFNINPYIPMAICICFCIATVVLTFTFKNCPSNPDTHEEQLVPGKRQERLERNAIRCAIVIAVFSTACGISFVNLKLLYQGRAEALFSPEMAVMLFSAVIIANRVARIALSFFSARISSWDPFKRRKLQIAPSFVAAALAIAIIGNFIDYAAASLILIAVGVVASNAALMPMTVALRQSLLENTESPQKALLFENLLKRIFTMATSGLLCLMLKVLPLPQCLAILAAILVALTFVFARWGKDISRKSSNFYYLNWEKTNTARSGDYAKSRKVLAKHYCVYAHMLVRNSVCTYSFDKLKQAYDEGKPCAVIIDDIEKEAWRPVIYLDEGGFVILDADKQKSIHLRDEPAKMLTTFDIYNEGTIPMKVSNLLGFFREGRP